MEGQSKLKEVLEEEDIGGKVENPKTSNSLIKRKREIQNVEIGKSQNSSVPKDTYLKMQEYINPKDGKLMENRKRTIPSLFNDQCGEEFFLCYNSKWIHMIVRIPQ